MRSKYIEEKFPRWFIFGARGDHVDVSDGNQDVLECVTVQKANEAIKERDRLVDTIVELALALDSFDSNRAREIIG